ncbi:MAG: DUF4125 family protein [Thermoplasmata archaeon]|nr:DUF4125 family protein [Thermoplasmata archaeon]
MEKKEILKKIADLEYTFFSKLKMLNQECDRERTFKFMRIARFYPFSQETLEAYLNDLENARLRGDNPLYKKYRCIEMGSTWLDEDKRKLIEQILQIETNWIKELREKYPHVIRDSVNEFRRYLECELSTFSPITLERYLKDVSLAYQEGRNLGYESYLYTFSQLGYKSLEDVERKMRENDK